MRVGDTLGPIRFRDDQRSAVRHAMVQEWLARGSVSASRHESASEHLEARGSDVPRFSEFLGRPYVDLSR